MRKISLLIVAAMMPVSAQAADGSAAVVACMRIEIIKILDQPDTKRKAAAQLLEPLNYAKVVAFGRCAPEKKG